MANKLGQSGRLNTQGELRFADIIDAVNNNFCLPAIQRGVVWSKEDIASFFDSLYKGFPVGSLLLWQLNTEEDRKITDYYPINTKEEKTEIRGSRKIYNFLRESNKRFCVIDGQQRITALYRGLYNKYIVDGKRYLLYFNLLYDGTEPSAFRYYSDAGFVEEKHLWIPVKSIWECHDDKKKRSVFINQFVVHFSENDICYKMVKGVRTRKDNATVRKIDSVVKYYNDNKKLADYNFKAIIDRFQNGTIPYSIVDLNAIHTADSTIEKLFDVFVRLNKNGRPLNPTDLLFAQIAKSSTVDSLWELFDNAVFQINNKHSGSNKKSKFSQDNLLRFIWLAFRQDKASFGKFFMTHANQVNITQKVMDDIEEAFVSAKRIYIDGHFSFDRNTPYSMFLPIAYYFYFGGQKTPTSIAEIERYYEVSMVSDAFGQSTDTVMSKIIEALGKNNRNKITLFRKREFDFSKLIEKIKENGGSFFDVSSNVIDDILKKDYLRDREYIKQILFLLSRKNRPDSTIEYDVDHMHPKKYADVGNEDGFFNAVGGRSEATEKLYLFYKEHVNHFANLQLLDEYGNRGEKSDKPLARWLEDYRRPNNYHEYAVNNYVCRADTPDGEPKIDHFELSNFRAFFEERKKVLRDALTEFFGIEND